MKVFSINPNTGKYFQDDTRHLYDGSTMYQGVYNYTPIFPLYTFSSSGRFNYTNAKNVIEFYTMLPVNKLLGKFLVEVRFRFVINEHEKSSLPLAISSFLEFCENSKKNINVEGLTNTPKNTPSPSITTEEAVERMVLLGLQKKADRWMTQQEQERLRELNAKLFANAGSPNEKQEGPG